MSDRGCSASHRGLPSYHLVVDPPNSSNCYAVNLHTAKGHGVDKYPAKSHAQRLASTLEVDQGLIVLAATPAATYPDSDQPVPFRQDRYFFYLTGCNEPDCYVTYDIEKDVLTLWLPAIDESEVVWTGRGSTVDEALEKYDVDLARYIEPQGRYVEPGGALGFNLLTGDYKPRSRSIIDIGQCDRLTREQVLKTYVGPSHGPARQEAVAVYTFYRCLVRLFGLPPELDGVNDHKDELVRRQTKLKGALDSCRVIKDEHEIELIRRANEVTAAAHTAVLRNIHRFTNEAEVEAAYTAVCIAKHAKLQAYSPIAGSGPNASVLHYDSNNENIGDREMLVLDAGCEVECYASDVTRTIPLNKQHPGHWPSKEAESIYKLVEKVQEACIKKMKPREPFVEFMYLARRMTIDGLHDLGILKGDREEIWKAGTVTGFFPHGLGHHLGLEVHDVSPVTDQPVTAYEWLPYQLPVPRHWNFANSSSASLHSLGGSSLEPGMVVTIEPGVYFNRFLLEQYFLDNPKHEKFIDKEVLERYWKVGGVRIEDDILVTRDGYENLTSTPKGEEMLKVIRKGAAGEGWEG